MDSYPKIIYLISGKRKAGKDYVATQLQKRLGKCSVIVRLSAPIKLAFAQQHGLDYQLLLSDAGYKESYRQQMIEWSEQRRAEDAGCFCRQAIQMSCHQAPDGTTAAGGGGDGGGGQNSSPALAWIVSDVRRRSDISWFRDNYVARVKTVRVQASVASRAQRGYVFCTGIDDVESECDLDSFTGWDLCVQNEQSGWGGDRGAAKSGGLSSMSSALFGLDDERCVNLETAVIVMHTWLHS